MDLKPGDLVYIKNNKKQFKFSHLFDGPFEVDKITSENSVMVKKGNKTLRVHKNNLKTCHSHGSIHLVNTFSSRKRATSI